MSDDSRREFLLRFAAIALAGSTAGCEQPLAIPEWPEYRAVYGPPPDWDPVPPKVMIDDFVAYAGDTVFFETDRALLTAEAKDVLRRQAEWLRRYPNARAVIEGHCDERGTREYNLALGERRANAVRDFLVAMGADGRNLDAVSYGKERPARPEGHEEAWAKNRRAVTILERR